jgi:ribosomal protein S12 methylthiotransferase accessory factor
VVLRLTRPDTAALDALPDLLDPETGIITKIDFFQPHRNDPQLVHCHASITDTRRLAGGITIPGTGGTALTQQHALVKAIGESVERYCGEFYDPASIVFSSSRKLGESCIPARRFILFHAMQYDRSFPFRTVSDDDVIGWVEAYSLTREQKVLVPARMVHFSYNPAGKEPLFEMSPVSGYACGSSVEEAVLSGICEVVERDAFMLFWYNWLPVPSLDLHAAESPVLRSVLQRFHPAPVRLYCSDITSDVGIPVCLALMVSDAPGWPAAICALAAHLDVEQAITKAMFELAANHLYVRAYFEQPAYRPIPRVAAEINEPQDHGLFYCLHENMPYLQVLTAPAVVLPPGRSGSLDCKNVTRNIQSCVTRLRALGLAVIVSDLTTPDIDGIGLKVVKVLIPGMQPIDFGQWRHLGGRRLYEVPASLGYRGASGPHELNFAPHPFP